MSIERKLPEEKLQQICDRFAFLETEMATASGREEIEALGREYSSLRDLVAQIDVYRALQRDLAEAEDMLEDDEMRVFAQEEIQTIKDKIPQLQKDLQLALLPKDEADDRSVIQGLKSLNRWACAIAG